jgi:NAD(P)-dependent dehydrogenase (short-subunit alcohol dehydrogenase family)
LSLSFANGFRPRPQKPRGRRCIVCRTITHDLHPKYKLLCAPCGETSLAKRGQRADLAGLTALITGGRMGIGHATALRMLRDGAAVHVTTRFPRHAAEAFERYEDFEVWRDRLRVYGLDLRVVPDVEKFTERFARESGRLDVLVNNAAQTVRATPAAYAALCADEDRRELTAAGRGLIAGDVAKGPPAPDLLPALVTGALQADAGAEQDASVNSWLLKDHEVSVLELLEVHVINAVAPFLLCGRLKPLMAGGPPRDRFIVNVTSKEGQFGGARDEKSWRHPHTNMAKAALNMFTRTCAQEYAKHRIYMNCVDPGWVSFQHPERMRDNMRANSVEPPFDAEDAAARICDPIYRALATGKPEHGTLFKDFNPAAW